MTEAEKITMVKGLLGNDATATDEVLTVYLRIACAKMLERLWPYDTTKTESDIPERYDVTQCELAARLFLRKGGEGELSHEENGINRSFASVDDDDILKRLTPYAKVGG